MGERRPSEKVDELEIGVVLKFAGGFPTSTAGESTTGIVANLPAAADHTNEMRIVTDAGAGNVTALVWSNGTNWIDFATGTTVAA